MTHDYGKPKYEALNMTIDQIEKSIDRINQLVEP